MFLCPVWFNFAWLRCFFSRLVVVSFVPPRPAPVVLIIILDGGKIIFDEFHKGEITHQESAKRSGFKLPEVSWREWQEPPRAPPPSYSSVGRLRPEHARARDLHSLSRRYTYSCRRASIPGYSRAC